MIDGHIPSSPTKTCITAHTNGTHVETQNPPALYTPAIKNPITAAPVTALTMLRPTNERKMINANITRVRRTLGRLPTRLGVVDDVSALGWEVDGAVVYAESGCRFGTGFMGIDPPSPSRPTLARIGVRNRGRRKRPRAGGNNTLRKAYVPTRT